MKTIKLLLAVLLLCVSQFALAVATPAEQLALDNAIAAVQADPTNQALVDAAVQAAANADIAADVIVTQLYNLGVAPQLITAAMNSNINLGTAVNGLQPSCAPNCGTDNTANVSYVLAAGNTVNTTLALLTAGGPTGAGGAPGAGGGDLGGGLGTGTTGGPNGAVSPG
ncbi:MAG: hypothetical protein Q7U37_11170 [Gallionella sp.]|nr:hypothetical protein [Gallionella sp.]